VKQKTFMLIAGEASGTKRGGTESGLYGKVGRV